jgi:molybdenum cofactor synthesis domain-containing protein
MDAAVVTVGDELLSGATENTNATWLARRLAERGVDLRRSLVVPDEDDAVATAVARYHDRHDRVVVTGGLGGTPDDRTLPAVADALARPLVVNDDAREAIRATAEQFRADNPDLVERYDLALDLDAQARMPEGARALANPVGLSPGCAVDGVYVLPGIPEEMRATFEGVADEFEGDVTSETLTTAAPEAAVADLVSEAGDRFGVRVGSYPGRAGADAPDGRVRVRGPPAAVHEATDWLRERIAAVKRDSGE